MLNEKEIVWNLVGFYDDEKPKGSCNEYGEILGGIKELNSIQKPQSVVIAIGKPATAKNVVSKITNPHVLFPNIISPDTIFFDQDNTQFGKGNIITVNCTFSCNVKIGDFNIFNSFITIGHDTVIGDFNSMMTSVKIAGEVVIGNENYFGSTSAVLQQVHIGNNTTIGSNSTIIRNTKDGNTYMGSPGTIVKF